MLLDHLLPELREIHRSSPQSPNQQGHCTCNLSNWDLLPWGVPGSQWVLWTWIDHQWVCYSHWLLLPGSPQVGYRLQFSIANAKNVAESLDSLPICIFNDLNHFMVTFALYLSPLSPGGRRKVLPTRSSWLNSGKDLLEVGPSSCLDYTKTVGVSCWIDLPTSEEEVGCLRDLEWGWWSSSPPASTSLWLGSLRVLGLIALLYMISRVSASRTMWVRESTQCSARPTQNAAHSSLSEGKWWSWVE